MVFKRLFLETVRHSVREGSQEDLHFAIRAFKHNPVIPDHLEALMLQTINKLYTGFAKVISGYNVAKRHNMAFYETIKDDKG